MKIAFDAKRYYHNNTGLGNYSRTLVDALGRLFPENEYMLYDEGSWTRTMRLGRRAVDDGCQIYHGLSNEIPMDAAGRIPTIVTIHDVCWRTYPEMYHWVDRHIYDLKYGRSCRKADKVLAISESTKRDIMEHYGVAEDRIEVIYQPVGYRYYTLMSDEEAKRRIAVAVDQGLLPKDILSRRYMLQVGAINARKNLMATVRAVKSIHKDHPDVRLLCIGSGHEYERKVRRYVSEKDMEEYVTFVSGVKDQALLQALYRKARVMVYPSYYEGFGLPVVEAQLQECPVITSTVSSLPEAGNGTALLVDPTDIQSLRQNMLDLLGDEDSARSLGGVARMKALEAFNHDMLITKVMKLYESIV